MCSSDLISEKWCLPRDREREIELNRAVLKQRIKWLGREAAKHSSERRHEVLTEMQACQGELNELKIPVSPVIDRVSVYSFIEEMSARDGVMAALGAEGSLLANLYAVSPEMIQPILKSWSMEPISEVTKKNGNTVVSHPRLHIGTAWQITESRKIIFAEKFSSIGLDSRFLYCELPKYTFSYGDGRNIPVQCEYWWKNLLSKIIDYIKSLDKHEKLQLVLSADAQYMLGLHRQGWEAHRVHCPGAEEFLCKAESHAVRIAVALHCIDEDVSVSHTISLDNMRKACEVTDFFVKERCRVVARMRDSKVRELALKVCQVFARGQVGQVVPGIFIGTRALAAQVGVTQKSLNRTMYWMAEHGFVLAVNVPVNSVKIEPGWQARQFLGYIQNEEMLP